MPVTDLVVLAAALDVPPVLLLYPDAPDGPVETLPGADSSSDEAIQWFSGDSLRPTRRNAGAYVIPPASEGVELMREVRKRRELGNFRLQVADILDRAGRGGELDSATREAIELLRYKRAELNAKIRALGGTVADQ